MKIWLLASLVLIRGMESGDRDSVLLSPICLREGRRDLRESDDQATKYEARLTQRIMTLFWFGELEPWQESTLLREFFENSGDRLWGKLGVSLGTASPRWCRRGSDAQTD